MLGLALATAILSAQPAFTQPAESCRIPEADLPRTLLSDAERERAPNNFIGVVTGAPGGVYAQLSNDPMRLLNDRAQQALRVAAILGQGSINDLADLRHLPRASYISAYESFRRDRCG
jgi:TRAP-type uncharacterized transport system substrate-binding protein